MNDTAPLAVTFPLVITEGNPRFVLRFANEGVTLNGGGLAWSYDGAAHSKNENEIAAIRLRRMPTPGADTGQCTITFSDGGVLNVMSWTPAGFADPGRAKIYRDFVVALHAQLSPQARSRIEFTSGFPGAGAAWRKTVGAVALVAAALLFVGTPLVLAFVTGDQQAYFMAAGGATLTYGLFWKVKRARALDDANRPQNYSPDNVPVALLP